MKNSQNPTEEYVLENGDALRRQGLEDEPTIARGGEWGKETLPTRNAPHSKSSS